MLFAALQVYTMTEKKTVDVSTLPTSAYKYMSCITISLSLSLHTGYLTCTTIPQDNNPSHMQPMQPVTPGPVCVRLFCILTVSAGAPAAVCAGVPLTQVQKNSVREERRVKLETLQTTCLLHFDGECP